VNEINESMWANRKWKITAKDFKCECTVHPQKLRKETKMEKTNKKPVVNQRDFIYEGAECGQ
jgi:hypothetical protein